MNITIEIEDGYPYINMKYGKGEWDRIKSVISDRKLELRQTENGFGCGYRFSFYADESNSLLSKNKESFINDINYWLYDDEENDDGVRVFKLNSAIFRILPDKHDVVRIPLEKKISIDTFKTLSQKIAELYTLVLEEKLMRTKVEIKFIEA
jgi:hypothetical protein